MPLMNFPLSASQSDIDSTDAFITAYAVAATAEKERLFIALKTNWSTAIKTPNQFGHLISCLAFPQMAEFYYSVNATNSSFLKNAAEFAQICIYLNSERIKKLCELIEQRLRTRGFIDNAQEFNTLFSIFSVSSSDNKEQQQLCLNTQQLQTIYDILKPKLMMPSFFNTLDEFMKLFSSIPATEDKKTLFEKIRIELPKLVQAKNDVNHIHDNLKPKNKIESDLFKRVREIIYRLLISDRTRLDKAFHAMLFLIFDNYPGKQSEKLQSIIDATFSDPAITDLDALLEKTENAMRFIEYNITSTRLKNAINHLMANLRTDEKKIDIDHIIQLAKSKDLIVGFFTEIHMESEATAQAVTYQPEF